MFLTVHGGQDLLSERSDVLGEASDLLGRQVLYSETQAVSWNGGKQFAGEGGGSCPQPNYRAVTQRHFAFSELTSILRFLGGGQDRSFGGE